MYCSVLHCYSLQQDYELCVERDPEELIHPTLSAIKANCMLLLRSDERELRNTS